MADRETIAWIISYTVVTGIALFVLAGAFSIGGGVGAGYVVGFAIGAQFLYISLKFHDYIQTGATDQPTEQTRKGPANQGKTEISKSSDAETRADNDSSAAGDAKSRRTAAIETVVAAGFGVIPATLVAHHNLGFPALSLGLGALTVAITLLLVNGRTYYAGAGAIFCFCTAATIYVGAFPQSYTESPFAVLVSLGAISSAIVSVHLGIGIVLQRFLAGVTGEKTALRIYDAIAAVVGLFGMIWAVLNIHERAVRYGGITIGGAAGFVLNFAGIELPIPWIIAEGVDATLVLYVGGILIGFHTLESLHTTWRAAKATADAGASGIKSGTDRATTAIQERREN